MKIKYPKNETVWLSYANKKGETIYILTSKPDRDYYFLYEVDAQSGDTKKLGRAKSPIELENKFDVISHMNSK